MSARTKIDDPDLAELLEGINRGSVSLPNFQRDFDWTDSDVRSLLATVINGWPLGSILLIDGDSEARAFYRPRPFEFAPPLQDDPSGTIVLDGQQRLTALYSALYGNPYGVHAIQVGDDTDWNNVDSVEASIRTIRLEMWERRFSMPADQWGGRLIPATSLRSAGEFFQWRDAATGDNADRILLTELYQNHLSGMHRYRIPALRIDSSVPPPAVARIFERVNRTGMRLGTFDLMVAKTFSPNFNLRDLWDEVRVARPHVFEFLKGDGTLPLQVIALRIRKDVRSSAVLDLTVDAVHDGWQRAVDGLEVAIDYFQNELGVLSREWLPYQNTLIVLAALEVGGSDLSGLTGVIKEWYWKSCFSGRYASASNSTAVADYAVLSHGENPSPAGFAVDVGALMESTKQSSGALHRSWMSLVAQQVARRIGSGGRYLIEFSSVLPRNIAWSGINAHLLTLGFTPTVSVANNEGDLVERADLQVLPAWDGVGVSEIKGFLQARAQFLSEALSQEVGRPVALQADETFGIVSD